MLARLLTHPTATVSPIQAQCEQSLLVPILMLCLLRAKELEAGQADPMTDNVLHAWSEVATSFTMGLEVGAVRQARIAATDLLKGFVLDLCLYCGSPQTPECAPYCSDICVINAEND